MKASSRVQWVRRREITSQSRCPGRLSLRGGHQLGRLDDVVLMMIAGQLAGRSSRHSGRRRCSTQRPKGSAKVAVIHVVIVGGTRLRLHPVGSGSSGGMQMMVRRRRHVVSVGSAQVMVVLVVRRGCAIAQRRRLGAVRGVSRCTASTRTAAGRIELRPGRSVELPGTQLRLAGGRGHAVSVLLVLRLLLRRCLAVVGKALLVSCLLLLLVNRLLLLLLVTRLLLLGVMLAEQTGGAGAALQIRVQLAETVALQT